MKGVHMFGLALALLLIGVFLPDAALAEAPLAGWHLDSLPPSDITPDYTGNGKDLTVNGATIVAGGRFGNAMSFAGGEQKGRTEGEGLEPATVTAIAWVHKDPGGAPGNYQYVLGKGAHSCEAASYALYTGGAGGLQFYIHNGSGTYSSPAATAATVWDGQWHAVAGSFDGSTVRLYVDGAEVGTGATATGGIDYSETDDDLTLGDYNEKNGSCGFHGLKGMVDEARVYGRALSASEISLLQDPSATAPPELPEPGGGGGGGGGGGEGSPSSPPAATISALRAGQPVKVKGATMGSRTSTWISGKASAAAPGHHLVALLWDFNADGTNDIACPPEAPAVYHQYGEPGTFTPVLTVEDETGAIDTATISVLIKRKKKKAGGARAAATASRNKAKKRTKKMAEEAACLTQKEENQPSTADCTRTIQFDVVEVNARSANCFKIDPTLPKAILPGQARTSSGAAASTLTAPVPINQSPSEALFTMFDASVRGPVSINGLYLPIPESIPTHYNSATGEIGLGERPISIDIGGRNVTLTKLNLNRVIEPVLNLKSGRAYDIGSVNLAGFGKIGGLDATGKATLRWVEPGITQLKINIALPKVFSMPDGRPAVGQIEASGSNNRHFQVDHFHIHVPKLLFGPVTGREFDLDYLANGGVWTGGATFVIPGEPDMELAASPTPGTDWGVQFDESGLRHAGGVVDFGGYAPQLFPGLFLQRVGFSFGGNPTRFLGTATVNTGKIVYVDGSILGVFPGSGESWPVPAGLPGFQRLAGRTISDFSIAGGGDVYFKVHGFDLPLGDAFILYTAPSRFEFQGGVNVPLGVFSAKGTASGFLDVDTRAFNMEGQGEFCVLELDACLNAELLASSKGIAGCGGFSAFGGTVSAGAGYRWGTDLDDFDLYPWGCEVAPYRVYAGASSATASASSSTFKLPPGLPYADMKLTGSGGDAPRVTVHGPKGETLSTGDRQIAKDGSFTFVRTPGNATTYIGIGKPSAGTWTVSAEAGSVPIGKTEIANGLEKPSVHASVSGQGFKRVLKYEVKQRPGQQVTFAEVGKDTYTEIGTAKGSKGSIPFKPGGYDGGSHKIVAIVEVGGLVTAKLKVASYKAPAQPKPARPAGLRITRKGATVKVRWERIPGVHHYAITMRTADGFAQATTSKKTSAKFGGLSAALGGVVSVAGVRVDGTQGPLGKAAFRPTGLKLTKKH